MVPILFILIGLAIVAGVLMFIKTKHFQHKIMWIVILFVAIILYMGYGAVIAGKNINLSNSEGLQTAAKLYMGWFANGLGNIKTLTSDAIKLNWISAGNSSSSPSGQNTASQQNSSPVKKVKLTKK